MVYSGTMGSPVTGAWEVGERCWHKASWGDDITSYAWGAGGGRLYVATSGIYGSGSVHVLDLRGRISRLLLGVDDVDEASETIFTIRRLDERAKRLEVVRESEGRRTTVFVTLAGTDSVVQAKP